jgi:hypothetical protein
MSEQWTLKGQIVVDHLLPELIEAFGARSGLGGITVHVSARSKTFVGWGIWNSWDKVKTGPNGHFEVSEDHGGDLRQFRVEILFDSDRLRLKEGQETSVSIDSHGFPIDIAFDLTDKDWQVVIDDSSGGPGAGGRKAGTIDLGAIPVVMAVAHKHADIWFLFNKIFDLFEDYGAAYAFKNKIVLKYPMGIGENNPEAVSYSNPFNGCLYIKGDEFHSRTMIHELMHQWAYERTTGEDSMAWQLLKHHDTHQKRENTKFVPFQEALAEWSSYKILKEVTGGKLLNFKEDVVYKYPDLPLNRTFIGDLLGPDGRSLDNVDFTECGWHSLFNILTVAFLDRCDFNKPLDTQDKEFAFYALFSAESYPEFRLGYSLKDVLSIFLKYPDKGIEDFLKKSELDFTHVLARAGAILPGLEKDKIARCKTYLDPNSTVNPRPN